MFSNFLPVILSGLSGGADAAKEAGEIEVKDETDYTPLYFLTGLILVLLTLAFISQNSSK